MQTIDKTQELDELARLFQRHELVEKQVLLKLYWMKEHAHINQEDMAAVLGKSQSWVSRKISVIAKSPEGDRIRKSEIAPAATAMELVRQAKRGAISHEELVRQLAGWQYDAPALTRSLLDEWQLKDNSTDAIMAAFDDDLITEDEYEQLVTVAKVA